MGRKSLYALILRAPLCGANNRPIHNRHDKMRYDKICLMLENETDDMVEAEVWG